jgi:DNA-directed RNA polymerase specialized sigma24 family protein
MQGLGTVGGATSELFEAHLDWAAKIGRNVGRVLPPSFDEADLQQIAVIEHWRRVELYKSSTGVPYRAYAYLPIKCAVLMACRRRNYKESTHDELKNGETLIDRSPRPDQETLAREECRRAVGSPRYLQRLRVLMALSHLPAEDADLVRQALAGASFEELQLSTPDAKKRLARAVQRLRRQLGLTRSRAVKKAATLPREKLLQALPTMPEADAYLVKRVCVEGQNVAALATTWGMEPAGLESRLRETLATISVV